MAKKDGTVDLRIQRTQKSIKQAFFDLIEEEGFDHISVKDITARAMISRKYRRLKLILFTVINLIY